MPHHVVTIVLTSVFQRIGSLCKILGKKEQDVRHNLGMLSSSESMDFSAMLLSSPDRWPQPANHSLTPPAHNGPRTESDTESGFEDGLWKSTGWWNLLYVTIALYVLKGTALDLPTAVNTEQ